MSHLHECFPQLVVQFHNSLFFSGKPDPPKDIRIDVVGNTAKISWIIPSNQDVTWSRVYVYDSQNKRDKFKDVKFPKSTFDKVDLKMCMEYNVSILYLSTRWIGNSDITTKTFWMTGEFIFSNFTYCEFVFIHGIICFVSFVGHSKRKS